MKKEYVRTAAIAAVIAGVAGMTAPAAAEQIIWNDSPQYNTQQPVYNNAPAVRTAPAAPSYGQSYTPPARQNYGDTVNGRHQNLDFDGGKALTKTDVKKLQRALSSRGFYKGSIDGLWGGQTTQAILDWQGATQQPLTGTVTLGTMRDLGVEVDAKKY